MTIHAAKGLEFSVVFVVNRARGTANRRATIRVATSGDEDGSVAVGDFQSSGDEDQANKEREETKRLLYVFFFQAEDGIRVGTVTGVQTCALPICFRELVVAVDPAHRRAQSNSPGLIRAPASNPSRPEWRGESAWYR